MSKTKDRNIFEIMWKYLEIVFGNTASSDFQGKALS